MQRPLCVPWLRASLPLLGLLLGAAPAVAQTIVPVEQEPHHRVVFENDVVRVIDAAVAVGQATFYHTHARDNVPVTIAGGRVAIMPIGRDASESATQVGQVSFAVGGYTHVVRNVGTTPLHFIDVELRTSAPAQPTAAPPAGSPLSGHVLALGNARVYVHRVVVAPGRRLDAHRHAGPVLEVTIGGDTVTRGATASPVVPGQSRWHGDGGIDAVVNTGRTAFEVVEVEWIK